MRKALFRAIEAPKDVLFQPGSDGSAGGLHFLVAEIYLAIRRLSDWQDGVADSLVRDVDASMVGPQHR